MIGSQYLQLSSEKHKKFRLKVSLMVHCRSLLSKNSRVAFLPISSAPVEVTMNLQSKSSLVGIFNEYVSAGFTNALVSYYYNYDYSLR